MSRFDEKFVPPVVDEKQSEADAKKAAAKEKREAAKVAREAAKAEHFEKPLDEAETEAEKEGE